MRVGNVGFKVLIVGSILAGAPIFASHARAARSHDHGGSPASSHADHVRVASSAHASSNGNAGDHGSSAHRGGGLKSSRGGGEKSAFADLSARSGHSGLQRAVFASSHYGRFGKNSKARIYAGGYSGSRYGVIQCVTFARADTGIDLSGNAVNWWDNAAGRYARGNRPEPGSVLNFRATGGMRLGHVSVVSSVVGPREIEIDHAHWGGPGSNGGGVARGVTVVDVSPTNDWSEVRVSLGGRGEFGSTYPTYGFIYNRPDNGAIMANSRARFRAAPTEEVAEAPARLRTVSANRNDDTETYDRNSQ